MISPLLGERDAITRWTTSAQRLIENAYERIDQHEQDISELRATLADGQEERDRRFVSIFKSISAGATLLDGALYLWHYIDCNGTRTIVLPTNPPIGAWIAFVNTGTGTLVIDNAGTIVSLSQNEHAMIFAFGDTSGRGVWPTGCLKIKSDGTISLAGMTISGATASRIAIFNASKQLASNAALTINGFIYPDGAGSLATTTAATDGQLLIGKTGLAPVVGSITSSNTNRVTVTLGAGTIALSGPQDIHTTASPTFTAVLSATFRASTNATAPIFRGWDTTGAGDAGTDVTLRGGDGSTGMSGVVGGNVNIRGGIGTTVGFVKVYKSNGSTVTIWSNDTGLGFFGVTPVAQQATTGTATGFTSGAGTAVKDDSTFTGGVGSTAYRISDIVLALKNLGFLAQ